MAIPDWPEAERPREKLLAHGAAALSDAELLAVFLRVGMPGVSAVDLARQLLLHFGSLHRIFAASATDFCALPGLGEAKYAQLQAVMEMARRAIGESMTAQPVFERPDAVADYLRLWLGREPREVFGALFLDSQHRLIAAETLFWGTIDQAAVHPRELVRRALEHQAAALIVAHNHPSGHTAPSAADLALTDRLHAALDLIDVRLLDHFIVGRPDVCSLAARGWRPKTAPSW